MHDESKEPFATDETSCRWQQMPDVDLQIQMRSTVCLLVFENVELWTEWNR